MASAASVALDADTPIRLRSVEAIAVDMPLPAAVRTPLSSVGNVVTLLVRATDEDGTEGWGEVWCNFPRFGIHHRARLLREVVAPMLVGRTFASPQACHAWLTRATRSLRLQSGEPGPVRAAIAGLDIATWDIAAKKAGQPLWRWLGGTSGRVPVYLSVGWVSGPLDRMRRVLDQGFGAVKVRSMGGVDDHVACVRDARAAAGDARELMVDLNASWEPDAAVAGMRELAFGRLSWLEEPVPVDAPAADWKRMADAAPMPLAGGENMADEDEVDASISLGALAVLQPDMTKWGGFTIGLPLARRIVAAQRRYCPHMFGGAVGTLAAAHLLAAANAPGGLLEWGVSPNPVRDAMMDRRIHDGAFLLDDTPGLGVRAAPDVIARHRIEA